jgi:CheY-like chemotaxis protein
LLAGRKLLLADDSITIQKVVDLTFADEGVSVVCVNNGLEAIERLEELAPDVVLADVFMPQMNGYEVCEYIKQNDKLKHIPVMLLVGSFEPFDEEEARRVGANDILTKPFQSIRRLIDKVGLLISNRPPEEQIPTAELPKPEVPEPEVEKLTTAELEITTADTQPLPAELRHVVEEANSLVQQEGLQSAAAAKVDQGMRESKGMETRIEVPEEYEGAGEVLLDLGEFDPGRSVPDDDFVLDIDLDEIPEPSPVEPAFPASAFVSRDSYGSIAQAEPSTVGTSWSQGTITSEVPATTDQPSTNQNLQRIVDEPVSESASEPTRRDEHVVEAPAGHSDASAVSTEQYWPAIAGSPTAESLAVAPPIAAPPTEISPQQLSPEMIDAIARRAVEHLSEKVVQEIAWEVVPQLAELLIKRQLEEKSS